jgi:hypothetical protein
MNPYPSVFIPAAQVAIRCKLRNRRWVITPASIFEFFHSCNLPIAHPFYSWLQANASVPCRLYFNPKSSFGRAILKLPFHIRYTILFSWLLKSSLFLQAHHCERILLPLLRKKHRKRKPHLPVVVILPFFPPLYLRPSPLLAPSPHLPSPFLLETTLSTQFLNSAWSSYQSPREGIG